jgi:hypothetical protein
LNTKVSEENPPSGGFMSDKEIASARGIFF